MKCIYQQENYVFVKTSVWDIFKSFICGHEALKGVGTCLLLAHINKHAKAFFNTDLRRLPQNIKHTLYFT